MDTNRRHPLKHPKRKYRNLLLQYHSDKNRDFQKLADEITKIIVEAHRNLSYTSPKFDDFPEQKRNAAPSQDDIRMQQHLDIIESFIEQKAWSNIERLLTDDNRENFVSMRSIEAYTARMRKQSPLLTAIQNGCDLDTVKRFVALGSDLAYQQDNEYGGMVTDIYFSAVKNSSLEVIQFLYDQLYDRIHENPENKEEKSYIPPHLDIESRYLDEHERCPLHYAIKNLYPMRRARAVNLSDEEFQKRLDIFRFLLTHDTSNYYEQQTGQSPFDYGYRATPKLGIKEWLYGHFDFSATETDKTRKAQVEATVKDALIYRDAIIEVGNILRNYQYHLNKIKTNDPLTLQKREVVNKLISLLEKGQHGTAEACLTQLMEALNKKTEPKIGDPKTQQSPAEILESWRMPQTKGHYALVPVKALIAILATVPCILATMVGQKKYAKKMMHKLFHVTGSDALNKIRDEVGKTKKNNPPTPK